MRRSDMVRKFSLAISQIVGESMTHAEHMEMASAMITLLENNGMSPPVFVRTVEGENAGEVKYFWIRGWEPEKEESKDEQGQ